MIPHFIIQKGKQEYLIIRSEDAFHLIDVNEALTREKRSTILESGCTPEQMQQMGLSGMTIPRGDISAVTVTGCGYQDEVIFYLGKRKSWTSGLRRHMSRSGWTISSGASPGSSTRPASGSRAAGARTGMCGSRSRRSAGG